MALPLFTLLAACSSGPGDSAGDLESIRERGELVVATRNAPTTYYINRDHQPAGPEYDLVVAYARELGVEPRFEVYDTHGAMIAGLGAGEADLAAGGLTRTEARSERFDFGPPYQTVRQQVVCRSGATPRNIEQLADMELHVLAGSSYVERLESLRDTHPDLDWTARDDISMDRLFRELWRGELDCTIADSNIVNINRRYYPELLVMFDLTGDQHLAWVLPAGSDALQTSLRDWLETMRESGRLADIREHYYGFLTRFDYVDKKRLIERIDDRYRNYDHIFESAAEAHSLPVALLAAQSYQESHWDPEATSPTGVRGIMMLTRPTAEELGVDDRLNPKQSIYGGARYLARLKSRLDEDIPQPDRTYLALAAYNIGYYHLRDAQTLARDLERNPHSWSDMREVLPLLADKQYYTDLPYGYARGTEPVRYVRRIRDYEDVISRYTRQ